jgi:enolase
MSHDLGFFTYKSEATIEDIRKVYLDSSDGKEAFWPSSSEIIAFKKFLIEKYPSINSLEDDELDENPWSCEFDQGEGYIIVSMVFSKSEEVTDYILTLLKEYQLIVYDPQDDKAYLGNDLLPESKAPKKWWQFWI